MTAIGIIRVLVAGNERVFSCRDDASNQALALRWGGEQLEGAHQALNAARAALKKLKAVEKKRKQKVRHMAMLHGIEV